ncbi:MAG: hypothetical protein H6851_11125 [Geminicoccaceae bacterium]|nr:hypothetical protein [Geminicoccaceae bacterium]
MAKQSMNAPATTAPVATAGAGSSFSGDAGPGAPVFDANAGTSETLLEREAHPMMVPPTETVAMKSEGIAAWHNGKKVTALWANSSPRNAFASIAGMGWTKLSNANDSAFLALTMLASHAEQTDSACNIRVENDKMIHEIYVW